MWSSVNIVVSHVGDLQVKLVVVRVRDHRPARRPLAMVRLLRLRHEDHLHKASQLEIRAILEEGPVQGTCLTRSVSTENGHQEERSVLLEAIMYLRRGIEAIMARPLSRLRRWDHRRQYRMDILRHVWIRQHILQQDWTRQHILQQDWTRQHILRRGWIRQRGPL